jgi:hypothetical protein
MKGSKSECEETQFFMSGMALMIRINEATRRRFQQQPNCRRFPSKDLCPPRVGNNVRVINC